MGDPTIKLLTWNLLHGGSARRMPEISLRLIEHAPDIAVLTEFRPTIGGQIAAILADRGLTHQSRSPAAPASNGILIASRFPLSPAPTTDPPITPACPLPGKWLEVLLPDFNTRLAGVHLPDYSRPTHRAAYWQFLVAYARLHAASPCIVLGDFNSGRHHQDESGATFTSTAMLGSFCTLGFHDAYRLVHPAGRDTSWVSHEGGAFRLDHAFVSSPLSRHVSAARYSNAEREDRVSDHAVLTVEMTLPTSLPPVENSPQSAPEDQKTRISR